MGCYNHCTLLKLQMKPAKVSDICMQDTLLGIASDGGSQVTLGWGGSCWRERGWLRVGALAGEETAQVRQASSSTARRVRPPFVFPASQWHPTYLHPPFLCSLVELYRELKET